MPGGERILSDMRTVIVVADDPVAAAEAERSLTTSGARVGARAGWHDALTAIADVAQAPSVFADARGVGDGTLAEVLPGLADAGRSRLVVAFAASQIDVVTEPLLGTDAILLCDASERERTMAIAVAMADDGLTVHDNSREADRLQQLNAEVARFAETLARLTGDRQDIRQAAPPSDPFVAEPASGFGSQPVPIDAAEIRRAIRARRLRDDAFGTTGLFEDPAWDMLLDLFAAELERRRVSVSSLCIAAAVAPTTALRWIGKLIDSGLLERRPDALDRRRAFISLSVYASTAMRSYVEAIRRAGLAIA